MGISVLGCSLVVEPLAHMCETLDSTPSTTKIWRENKQLELLKTSWYFQTKVLGFGKLGRGSRLFIGLVNYV